MRTPWGKADDISEVFNGVKFYSTPNHGGFKVDKSLLSVMPKKYVIDHGWYEEDCDSCKVVLAFPEKFDSKTVDFAQTTWNYWFNEDGTYKKRS
jgi:hypothetical protein